MYPECLRTYYENLQRLIEENYGLAVQYADVDGIHDMRVAIKRLRAYFNLIEWINPVFPVKKTLTPIRRLFKSAGNVRDIHVQQESVRRWMSESDLEMSEYYNFLKKKEMEERKRFFTSARTFDLGIFPNNWSLIQNALSSISTEYIQNKVEERFNTEIGNLIKFKQKECFIEEDYHAIRISSKESRYMLEVLQKCFPTKDNWTLLNEALRKVHQALGRWHDDDVALVFLDAFLLASSGMTFFDKNSYATYKKYLAEDKAIQLKEFGQRWPDFLALMN